jgi:hypothetical protein
MHTNKDISLHAGDWIYQLFMHHACVFIKHNTANIVQTPIINEAKSKCHLSKGLYEAFFKFQLQVHKKQPYLANWVRKSIIMSFDAMTTSPVESINCHIKYKSKVSAALS